VNGAGRKPGAGWISPRLLLFFSCLVVMIFARQGTDLTSLRVGALLVAAGSTGVALFRPMVVVDLDRLRRAERALVSILLVAGLILTAGMLARAFADPASPGWFAVIVVYAILGLAAALPMTRRLPHLKWAFPFFLLAHAVTTVLFLRLSLFPIDVQVFLHDGAGALLHGHNPYSMTFPNIYQPPYTELFYGPGVVVDGRITYGFPYLPVALLVAIPGKLLGDVRYGQLIAMLVSALVLRQLASDRIGRAAAVLGVAAPSAIAVLSGAWTEPTLVALLACLVLALERRRHAFASVLLGLFFVSKQYAVVAIPVIWLIRQWLTRRMLLVGVGAAAAVTLPFFLVNSGAFWKAIVEFQLVQPFRSDSLSLLVSSVNTFGWPPPWTYSVLPLVGGGLTAIALALRAPRTPPAFAAGIGLTLLVTILLSKQAFMNYYFLVSGAFLIAAVAWPTPRGPAAPTIGSPD
jgi:hypothetical protein